MSQREIDQTAELLRESKSVLFFTGAGISTGSGIPDFRGPKGLWKSWRPVYYQEFLTDQDARQRHWDYKLEGWKGFREASPNPAHMALVEFEQMGRLTTLVTQNIDGLHQDAGQDPSRIIEIHGTNRRIECTSCGRDADPDPVFRRYAETRQPPTCDCGGFLKPATISFGQAMPRAQLENSFEAASRCDLVIAIGSTLEVEPAASIPRAAAERGIPYVIVNMGETAHDRLATVRLEGDVTLLLPRIADGLRRLLKAGPSPR